MKQKVRIIGGKYRGKKLSFPATEELRPTPDRVRETAFNWLMQDIGGSRCLDAFAGSGALGLEAYSRGALEVRFVEASGEVYQHLSTLIAEFNTNNLLVIQDDALNYLRYCNECFDIIFLDPPFTKNYIPTCLDILAHSKILRVGGLVYLESADKIAVNPVFWEEKKSKRTRQLVYGLYKKN